ncbi:EpsG family protein [Faecalicatena sp. Marseille-Q4148]|nr:EpsG family protein [Faecalicatena sp. Marseille-Q4148]
MLIYLLLLVTILVLNVFRKNGNISNRFYCIVICSLFICITGLRHNTVGSDTTGYYLAFYRLSGSSLAEIISLEKRDFGFYIFEWLVDNIFHNFVAVTLIAACVFYIPITILIYKYSDDYGMSYLVLMAFMFFQFSMTGIRQTMALGFAVMFVLELLKKEKKIWKLLIYGIIGITLHRSCLMILPMLFIPFFKKSRFIAKICFVLLPIIFAFRGNLTSRATSVFEAIGFELETYSGSSGGITTLVVYFLLFAWGLFFTYKNEKENELLTAMLSIMGMSTILQIFVSVNSVFFRIVWYYSIFLTIYIPRMLTSSRVDRKSYLLLKLTIYAGLLYMYLGITIGSAYVIPYSFFWQGV